MKKKIISAALAAFIAAALAASLCGTAFADETASADSVSVYVTISDGSLVLSHASVTVTDTDSDGSLTINDALTAAHDAYYDGGAEAGYASETGDYGLSLTKLWGVENGGSYGYYVNNASAWSLADTVASGDVIVAFVYTDTTSWSDVYSFFDVNTAAAASEDEITLTLSYVGYDDAWNTVNLPVEGAVITVDGKATEYVTDENGKAVITISDAGEHIVSATSSSLTLVPPVCVVTVESAPQTGDAATLTLLLAIAAAALLTAVRKRGAYAA